MHTTVIVIDTRNETSAVDCAQQLDTPPIGYPIGRALDVLLVGEQPDEGLGQATWEDAEWQ